MLCVYLPTARRIPRLPLTGLVLVCPHPQVWEYLEQNFPDALGPVNPNNAAIFAKFGNQGGYGNE